MPTTVAPETSVLLHVTALHENVMLARITSVIALFDVDQFTYRSDPDGRAEVVVSVSNPRHVDRVAAKIARLVGVLDVLVESAPAA